MLTCHEIGYDVDHCTLLKSINLDVRPGEILTILGPNGAGKSTLLKILSGELQPTTGDVKLDGVHLSTITAGALASRRAVVPQSSSLTFSFTVLEVVLLGISVPGFRSKERKHEVDCALSILEQVGLYDLAERFYPNLSGGEKQRVQIARALCQLAYAARDVQEPQFLLLDEATANLDIAHQNLICQILRSQADLGRAVVLVAHDLDLAAALSDRIALMKDATMSACGFVEDIFQDRLLSDIYDCKLKVEKASDGRPSVRIIRDWLSAAQTSLAPNA